MGRNYSVISPAAIDSSDGIRARMQSVTIDRVLILCCKDFPHFGRRTRRERQKDRSFRVADKPGAAVFPAP